MLAPSQSGDERANAGKLSLVQPRYPHEGLRHTANLHANSNPLEGSKNMAFSPKDIKIRVNSREIHAIIQKATGPPFPNGKLACGNSCALAAGRHTGKS